MNMKLEALKQRLEAMIENTIDVIIEIEKLEQKQPGRELSDWHQIGGSMIFYHIITRSLWKKFEGKGLTQEQREILITEITGATKEHLKELYGFDTLKLSNEHKNK